ncbi:TonB-dependent receptor [Phenylobacterium sp.]|uniref:TonB-dependent receptor n=1 Tax=Phenylobacterium sp. TaxID=1871053 RepID=UPI0025DACAE7|nr:TonB-dependent receptor [Phenylobacterium sp.]
MRNLLLGGVAALVLGVLVGAPEACAASAPEAPDSVSEGASSALEEVIVTARRRSEAAQDIPVAVSVLTASRIEDAGVFTVGRLQQLAPSFQYFSSNPRNTTVNIRGLGVPFGLTSDGFEQGVGVYVDDVYYARAAAATFDFLDVAQVEVLRGPQGTLYGKNTTAGAINITTEAPTFAFEAKGEVTLGDLDFRQVKGAISGPLTETIAGRFALSSTSRRGTIWNVRTQTWVNSQDNLGLRGQLLIRPRADLDILLAADYSAQDPECCAQIYVRTGATQRPLARQYAALAAAQGYAVPSTNAFDRRTDLDASLNAGNIIGGASARVKWDVGTGTLTSVTAWRFWDWKPENDRDFLGLSIVRRSQNPSQQDQYQQEIRFDGSSGDFDYVAGLFAFHQRIDTQGTEEQGANASRWTLTGAQAANPAVLDGLVARNTQWLTNTSAALFGQVSWKVTEALTLQPGLRINYDEKEGYYLRRVFDGQGAPVLFGQTDPVKVAQRSVYAPQQSAPRFSDWNLSYDLTASYRFTGDILGYATYAKAFKTGGINQNGLPTDAAGNPILAAGTIRPEDVNHLEAGLKTRFPGLDAIVNLALFRTEIRDYQATVTNGQLGVLRGYLANAGRVRSQGAEIDASIAPTAFFSAYVNAAWTDARYVRFVDAPCPPELSGGTTAASGQTPSSPGTPGGVSPANCDISGGRLPGVSEWAFTYGAETRRPAALFGRQGEVYLGLDGSWRSDFSSNASPSAYTNVKAYGLVGLRAGFRAEEGLEVFAWVRNALDAEYYEFLAVGPGNTGLIAGQPGDPRTVGLTLRLSR